jgi:hypothetical protein
MASRTPLPNLRVSIKPTAPSAVVVIDASPLSPRPLSTSSNKKTTAVGGQGRGTTITRRRLRASLPPSPVASRVPPPQAPSPWRWRCCSCRATYDLSVTQRCLLCSHTFCSLPSQTRAASLFSSSGSNSSSRKRTSPRSKRRVDRSGNTITCTTEFDYEGWSAYGAWRRRVTGTQITEDQRDRIFLLRRQHDWHHCDYPSQCAHRRRELQPVWQDILLSDTSSEDEEAESHAYEDRRQKKSTKSQRRPSTALSPDDDLVMNEAISLHASGRVRKQTDTDMTTLSDQQVLDLFAEDDGESNDNGAIPLDYMSQPRLRVRNHAEIDWENFSSDDSDDSDDEDLVDADGNLVKWRSNSGREEPDERGSLRQSQVLLVKAANSFWGATDF